MALLVCLAAIAVPPPLSGYSEVPVRRSLTTGWWSIQAEVGGRPAELMLDTGAAHNEWYSAPPFSDVRVGTAISPLVRFRTGRQQYAEPEDAQYQGMAGIDLLGSIGAVFDFGRSRLYVRRPSQSLATLRDQLAARAYRPVELSRSIASGLRYLDVLHAKRRISLAIDSGGAVNLLFVDSCARVGIRVAKERFLLPSGAGLLTGHGTALPVCNLSGTNRPLGGTYWVVERPTEWDYTDADGRRFDGVVGLPWLTANRAVFDVTGNSLYLPDE